MTRDFIILLHFHYFYKAYQEKSLKDPWISLQIWLWHLRKTIIIFKDQKPASKIKIWVIVVCLTFRSKTTHQTFSSFQIQFFCVCKTVRTRKSHYYINSGNKRDQKSIKKSFISNMQSFSILRT